AYGAGDIDVIDRDGRALDRDARRAREFGDSVLVVERDAVLKRLPSHGAVHRAAVDVPVPESARDGASDCPFSGAGRPVDGDDQGFHPGAPERVACAYSPLTPAVFSCDSCPSTLRDKRVR